MVHPVQSVVESLYAAGRCPRLHVNALCEGVVCPDFIREQWRERLIIDLDSSYPLDLTFADAGIGADLSFGGYVTRCNFPWQSIYVVADRATGRGIVLEQHMPEAIKKSRGAPPTTGPLQLRLEPDQTEPAIAPIAAVASAVEDAEPEPGVAAATEPVVAPQDDPAKRRRAAFRVIDGGA
jgi:stringent starvation protein B